MVGVVFEGLAGGEEMIAGGLDVAGTDVNLNLDAELDLDLDLDFSFDLLLGFEI